MVWMIQVVTPEYRLDNYTSKTMVVAAGPTYGAGPGTYLSLNSTHSFSGLIQTIIDIPDYDIAFAEPTTNDPVGLSTVLITPP